MRIWIINHYALHPSQAGGTRHFTLAKHLVERGHRVTLVASSVDYTSRTDTRLQSRESWHGEVHDGVSFVWLRTPPYSGNGLGRVANMLAFAAQVRFALAKYTPERPDIVLGSSPHPFAALAAERVARRLRVPFVLEVRDLWPQSLLDLGNFSEHHPFIMGLDWIERYLYRAADRIICLLPGAEGHIRSRGASAGKITWIPNGIDLSLVPPYSPPQANGNLRLMYAGAHGIANGLYTILDAAALLRTDGLADRVMFEFVGDGPEKPRLKKRTTEMGLLNVKFTDPLPKDRIHEKMQQADAFLMLLKDSPVFRWGISPNKLFDYMVSARPVIFGVNTPVNPVQATRAGITILADDPYALVEAIKRLLSTSIEERMEMGLRGREYVEQHHDMSRLAGTLEEVFTAVTAGSDV